MTIHLTLPSESFLEYAFLRWVLAPATQPEIVPSIIPQQEFATLDRTYRIDYAILGASRRIAIELDGFEYHSQRQAFSYDRLRQNDIQAADWLIVRFSYDAIRSETRRCIEQLQAVLALDSYLRNLLITKPIVEQPAMDPGPIHSLAPSPAKKPLGSTSYFDQVRSRLNLNTLRTCQQEAFAALSKYFSSQGRYAACVMSVGAGKTALGVLSCLAFARQRALIITPGSVIRGTFHKALDHQAIGNVLYGLPSGPLIPGYRPPHVLTLDRDDGPIRQTRKQDLLAADIILTNFHSLGTGDNPNDLISKLQPEDIDLIVVDEAHIAAADSYQRTFRHFNNARTLLMSACFKRLDGKPIDADVVYRYRLIDSIADGHAKNLRIHRFAPDTEQTAYEIIWTNGSREDVIGREALLEIIRDEKKLAYITAKSDSSIRQIMRVVKQTLDQQVRLLSPIKPRVLFSALGERHAEQVSRIATEYGIPCQHLHHSMSESRIRAIRARFEQESGDLQGIVQLKMLGQGYDFPPITVVVPMRPYGSFSEFYQFIGRGIRVLQHPAVIARTRPGEQFLDIVYHAELGLDEHIADVYQENDMGPPAVEAMTQPEPEACTQLGEGFDHPRREQLTSQINAFVIFEQGAVEQHIIHDQGRVEQRRKEREREAFSQRYADYVQKTNNPVPFEQYVEIMRKLTNG